MKAAIEKILKGLNLLEAFTSNTDYYVKIENKGYMPLSIEKHGSQVTIAHYFEHGGDLIADPDMEFEVIEGEWSPVAIQHSTGHYFRAVEYRDGKKFVSRNQLRDQRQFARLWGRNLIAQGFAHGKVLATEIS
jgi:hypothetical protein